MEDLLDRLEVMLMQETAAYQTSDYLSLEFQQKLQTDASSSSGSGGSEMETCSMVDDSTAPHGCDMNETWREKICEWCYQVVDHFEFSREVVMIAMNFLDRYLATRSVNKKVFQLAAMTALFLAIKLNESGKLTMGAMIELSRGFFRVDQMAAMEMDMLSAMKWNVHPPTSFNLTRYLLCLLPASAMSLASRHDTLELSRFLTELSVMDYFFVSCRPSTVALAALLNAMESIPTVPYSAQLTLVAQIHQYVTLDPYTNEVNECRARLRLHYQKGGYAPPSHVIPEDRDCSVSPVCVAQVPTTTDTGGTMYQGASTTTTKTFVDMRQEDETFGHVPQHEN